MSKRKERPSLLQLLMYGFGVALVVLAVTDRWDLAGALALWWFVLATGLSLFYVLRGLKARRRRESAGEEREQ